MFRFIWLLGSMLFLARFIFETFHVVPFSLEFFLFAIGLTAFQSLQIYILDLIFKPKKSKLSFSSGKITFDEKIGLVSFTVAINDLQKMYAGKHIHEILSKELNRMDEAVAKYSKLTLDVDFELTVNIDEADANYFIYTIKAKTERAKTILLDVSKSFDLVGLL